MENEELDGVVLAIVSGSVSGVSMASLAEGIVISRHRVICSLRRLRASNQAHVQGLGMRARWYCTDQQKANLDAEMAALDKTQHQKRLERYRINNKKAADRNRKRRQKELECTEFEEWFESKPKKHWAGTNWTASVPTVNSVFSLAKA